MLKTSRQLTWKMISDPLYGYAYFNAEFEEPVINNVLIQRLRYIMQLQTAHLVYPGAVHTRFQHSIGTMHLTGLMAEDMVSKTIMFYGKEALGGYDPHVLIEASRLAGLLHDAGHAAFSHAFEHGILWRRNIPRELSNHEKIGLFLIKHLLDELLDRADKELPGLKTLVYSILGEEEPKGFLRVLRWIVKEGYYPADVIDFLRRDSYYAGTIEYGSILYERLYKNTYPLIEGDKAQVVLDRIALGEFKQYMYAKANMYEHVYYHSVCRSFDKLLYEALSLLDEELGLTSRVLGLKEGRLKDYLELTDAYMYGVMMHKALSEDTRLGYLCRRLLVERKPEWRRVSREVVVSSSKGLDELEKTLRLILDHDYRRRVVTGIEEYVFDKLKQWGFSREELWIDILDITPLPKSTIYPGGEEPAKVPTLLIGKRVGGEIVVSEEFNLLMEELPLKILVRAYVPRSKYSGELEFKMTNLLSTAVENALGIDLSAAERVIKNVYSEYMSRDYSKYRITA